MLQLGIDGAADRDTVQRLFQDIDEDGSGAIDLEEFRTFIRTFIKTAFGKAVRPLVINQTAFNEYLVQDRRRLRSSQAAVEDAALGLAATARPVPRRGAESERRSKSRADASSAPPPPPPAAATAERKEKRAKKQAREKKRSRREGKAPSSPAYGQVDGLPYGAPQSAKKPMMVFVGDLPPAVDDDLVEVRSGVAGPRSHH